MAPWPLFVFGAAGVGKTCGLLYLADRTRRETRWTDFAALCDVVASAKCGRLIREEWRKDVRLSPQRFWREWADPEMCVIDEVGLRGKVSDHQFDTLKRAIDDRYGLPLTVISNLDLEGIGRLFDDRIASRLAGGTVVEVAGPDQRLQREPTVTSAPGAEHRLGLEPGA